MGSEGFEGVYLANNLPGGGAPLFTGAPDATARWQSRTPLPVVVSVELQAEPGDSYGLSDRAPYLQAADSSAHLYASMGMTYNGSAYERRLSLNGGWTRIRYGTEKGGLQSRIVDLRSGSYQLPPSTVVELEVKRFAPDQGGEFDFGYDVPGLFCSGSIRPGHLFGSSAVATCTTAAVHPWTGTTSTHFIAFHPRGSRGSRAGWAFYNRLITHAAPDPSEGPEAYFCRGLTPPITVGSAPQWLPDIGTYDQLWAFNPGTEPVNNTKYAFVVQHEIDF